jgi:hypothetical protein
MWQLGLNLLGEGLIRLEDLWIPQHLNLEGAGSAARQVLGGHRVLSARLQRHLPENNFFFKWTMSTRFWAVTVYFPPASSETCRKSIYF